MMFTPSLYSVYLQFYCHKKAQNKAGDDLIKRVSTPPRAVDAGAVVPQEE
jgi:hypothetical protein